jgi:hypothetical protein
MALMVSTAFHADCGNANTHEMHVINAISLTSTNHDLAPGMIYKVN